MTWDEFFADLERRQKYGVDIMPYPHPVLRYKAVPVEHFGEELQKVVRIMFERMYEWKGVGLAAPQIGLPLRIFVTNHTVKVAEGRPGIEHNPKQELVFINPTIQVKEAKNKPARMVEDYEGCLSLIGLNRPVRRANTITFTAQKANGDIFKGEYNGLVARIIQHENDHLDGKLFIDHLDGQAKEGVPEWLTYLTGHFEGAQRFGTFKSIEEEEAIVKELEKLAKPQ